jgi:hypothetical protein
LSDKCCSPAGKKDTVNDPLISEREGRSLISGSSVTVGGSGRTLATGTGILFLFAVFWVEFLKQRGRRKVQSNKIAAVGESAVINTRSTQNQPEEYRSLFCFKSIAWPVRVKLAHTR